MAQAVRSFLAVELSKTLKSEAQLFLESIREELAGFRLIPPQNWHVTLHFLGQVEPEKIEQIASRLPGVLSDLKPFSLSLSGFGAFPNTHNPRILWIGVSGDIQSLSLLKSRLDQVLQKLHFKIETRPFHPHITIARAKTERAHFIPKPGREFQGKAIEQVRSVTLFRSTLSGQGATYTPLHVFPLR